MKMKRGNMGKCLTNVLVLSQMVLAQRNLAHFIFLVKVSGTCSVPEIVRVV